MGHLLLSWISARLGFPIWKWFLWKTSHCCWLPIIVVRWTEGQEGSEPLNNKPQKFPGVCQVKVTEQSYLSLGCWQNISLVITLTISTCSASLWKTKPSVLLIQGTGSCLRDTQRTSPKHHRDFQREQIPVSEQATVTSRRWHHTEDLWLVCPKFNEERTSPCATPFDLVLGSNRSTLCRM